MAQSLRIAFVTPEFVSERNFDGGLANYLLRAGLSLAELGHEPHVVVASDRNETIDVEGIEVHRVDVASKRWEVVGPKLLRGYWPVLTMLLHGLALNRRLRRLHRVRSFDSVQYSSYRATALFRVRGIPAVVRLSSLESLWDRAYERTGGATGPSRLATRLERASLRRADCLISPSELVAGEAERLLDRPVEVVESPYLARSLELDDSVFRAHLAGRRYALFFGTIGLLKGVKTIAEMLPALFEFDKELVFAFVGKQGNHLGRPMIEFVRAKAGVEEHRVVHLERLAHEQLLPIIDHASVVVLPSRIDNFPNACLEAMARGRLVVGTRGASFDQLIEEGVSGFLCEIDDRESLLAAVKRALVCEAPEAVAARARQRVECLRPQVAGAALVGVHERLLGVDPRDRGGSNA